MKFLNFSWCLNAWDDEGRLFVICEAINFDSAGGRTDFKKICHLNPGGTSCTFLLIDLGFGVSLNH